MILARPLIDSDESVCLLYSRTRVGIPVRYGGKARRKRQSHIGFGQPALFLIGYPWNGIMLEYDRCGNAAGIHSANATCLFMRMRVDHPARHIWSAGQPCALSRDSRRPDWLAYAHAIHVPVPGLERQRRGHARRRLDRRPGLDCGAVWVARVRVHRSSGAGGQLAGFRRSPDPRSFSRPWLYGCSDHDAKIVVPILPTTTAQSWLFSGS